MTRYQNTLIVGKKQCDGGIFETGSATRENWVFGQKFATVGVTQFMNEPKKIQSCEDIFTIGVRADILEVKVFTFSKS